MTRQVRPNPPRARDPYGVGPLGASVAPILSIVGLVIVGIVTLNLLQGQVPFGIGGGGDGGNGGNGDGGPIRTAAPSNVVIIPDEAAFEGSIVYAKGGNVWIQTDDEAKQLTDSGKDSMPSWSPDGRWIFYINTVREKGRWAGEDYALDVPRLMRVQSDGSGEPEVLKSGKFTKGKNTYAYWIRQPVLSPDGTQVAIISDAPNPDDKTLTVQFYGMESDKITDPGLETNGSLGHQDPDWRPDGKYLVYVKNGRDGSRGAPVIMRYDPSTGKAGQLTGFGYLYPAYSRDGKYLAATRTSAFGTDIVILDASNGQELERITNDGSSWAPTWSPAGDGIAFLHLDGQTVDLRLAKLEGAAPDWTVSETIELTEVSDLEPASKPDWFIPADQLPPLPTPAPSAAASTSASAAP